MRSRSPGTTIRGLEWGPESADSFTHGFRLSLRGLSEACGETLAAACLNESDHLTLVSEGDGDVVSKEVGEASALALPPHACDDRAIHGSFSLEK